MGTCETCRYWSDLQVIFSDGVPRAKCMCTVSPDSGYYKRGRSGCGAHQRGEAVDTPGEGS